MALNYSSGTLTATSIDSLTNSTTTGFASTNKRDTPTTNNIVDTMVSVKITAGAITPSASTNLIIYVVGSEDGTNWAGGSATAEVFTDNAETNTLSATSNNLKFLGTINCHTASISYRSNPMSIAAAFGGVLPKKWKIVVQNQTGQTLGTSSVVSYTDIYYN